MTGRGERGERGQAQLQEGELKGVTERGGGGSAAKRRAVSSANRRAQRNRTGGVSCNRTHAVVPVAKTATPPPIAGTHPLSTQPSYPQLSCKKVDWGQFGCRKADWEETTGRGQLSCNKAGWEGVTAGGAGGPRRGLAPGGCPRAAPPHCPPAPAAPAPRTCRHPAGLRTCAHVRTRARRPPVSLCACLRPAKHRIRYIFLVGCPRCPVYHVFSSL